MQFEWIRTIPTKYQPLGEDSTDKSSSFLQHLPQVCQVEHTIDRCIMYVFREVLAHLVDTLRPTIL